MFENCVSKLSFDLNEKSEFACKYTMPSKAFWQTIYLMKNAALGLNNLLMEYFRNNERNLCFLGDGFLACWNDYKDEGRAADVICLGFRKAFDTVGCSVVIWKLRTNGLNAWMVRWVESWQDCWAWREVINSFDVQLVPGKNGVWWVLILRQILHICIDSLDGATE